jgi:hypothetical protein
MSGRYHDPSSSSSDRYRYAHRGEAQQLPPNNNNNENARPQKMMAHNNNNLHHHHHKQLSSRELLHRARSEIVDQVRNDIRKSNWHVLKESNHLNTGGGGLSVAHEKQRLEEIRQQAKMAETSLHEKMDETKERIMERVGSGHHQHHRSSVKMGEASSSSSYHRHPPAANTNNNSSSSSKNVSQWMDSVVAKAKRDASMSPPSSRQHGGDTNNTSNNTSATESLREAAKNAREAVSRAVYGTSTVRKNEEKENTPPPAVRRSFSAPSPPTSIMSFQQQHEETDAKVTKAMLKSALKQTGELRTELRETKMALDGVKANLETAENDLKKERESREEDKLKFEAAKNELETSREAAREALAREVSVTQELTKKLSAKRDEALEQRNLADKFKRELEQLRSELRNLKNENESWIRKAEAANETSRRRSSDQQKEVPKVSSSQQQHHHHHQQQQQQQQQRSHQSEQHRSTTTTTTTTAQPQQSQQQQQQVNWTRERREAEELKTKGNRAFHANKFEEALQSYTAALQVNFEDQPFRAVLHANRAAALQSSKKHLEAIVACCESQFFDKSYIRAIQRRADAYLSIGDWTMAAKDLETLVPIMGKECDAKLREVKMNIQRGLHIEHYAVLGVSSRASASEIRASYLKKSLKHHPDKAETEHTKEIAELMFKRVCEAYKVLSDANKRRAYDNSRILASSNAYNRRY